MCRWPFGLVILSLSIGRADFDCNDGTTGALPPARRDDSKLTAAMSRDQLQVTGMSGPVSVEATVIQAPGAGGTSGHASQDSKIVVASDLDSVTNLIKSAHFIRIYRHCEADDANRGGETSRHYLRGGPSPPPRRLSSSSASEPISAIRCIDAQFRFLCQGPQCHVIPYGIKPFTTLGTLSTGEPYTTTSNSTFGSAVAAAAAAAAALIAEQWAPPPGTEDVTAEVYGSRSFTGEADLAGFEEKDLQGLLELPFAPDLLEVFQTFLVFFLGAFKGAVDPMVSTFRAMVDSSLQLRNGEGDMHVGPVNRDSETILYPRAGDVDDRGSPPHKLNGFSMPEAQPQNDTSNKLQEFLRPLAESMPASGSVVIDSDGNVLVPDDYLERLDSLRSEALEAEIARDAEIAKEAESSSPPLDTRPWYKYPHLRLNRVFGSSQPHELPAEASVKAMDAALSYQIPFSVSDYLLPTLRPPSHFPESPEEWLSRVKLPPNVRLSTSGIELMKAVGDKGLEVTGNVLGYPVKLANTALQSLILLPLQGLFHLPATPVPLIDPMSTAVNGPAPSFQQIGLAPPIPLLPPPTGPMLQLPLLPPLPLLPQFPLMQPLNLTMEGFPATQLPPIEPPPLLAALLSDPFEDDSLIGILDSLTTTDMLPWVPLDSVTARLPSWITEALTGSFASLFGDLVRVAEQSLLGLQMIVDTISEAPIPLNPFEIARLAESVAAAFRMSPAGQEADALRSLALTVRELPSFGSSPARRRLQAVESAVSPEEEYQGQSKSRALILYPKGTKPDNIVWEGKLHLRRDPFRNLTESNSSSSNLPWLPLDSVLGGLPGFFVDKLGSAGTFIEKAASYWKKGAETVDEYAGGVLDPLLPERDSNMTMNDHDGIVKNSNLPGESITIDRSKLKLSGTPLGNDSQRPTTSNSNSRPDNQRPSYNDRPNENSYRYDRPSNRYNDGLPNYDNNRIGSPNADALYGRKTDTRASPSRPLGYGDRFGSDGGPRSDFNNNPLQQYTPQYGNYRGGTPYGNDYSFNSNPRTIGNARNPVYHSGERNFNQAAKSLPNSLRGYYDSEQHAEVDTRAGESIKVVPIREDDARAQPVGAIEAQPQAAVEQPRKFLLFPEPSSQQLSGAGWFDSLFGGNAPRSERQEDWGDDSSGARGGFEPRQSSNSQRDGFTQPWQNGRQQEDQVRPNVNRNGYNGGVQEDQVRPNVNRNGYSSHNGGPRENDFRKPSYQSPGRQQMAPQMPGQYPGYNSNIDPAEDERNRRVMWQTFMETMDRWARSQATGHERAKPHGYYNSLEEIEAAGMLNRLTQPRRGRYLRGLDANDMRLSWPIYGGGLIALSADGVTIEDKAAVAADPRRLFDVQDLLKPWTGIMKSLLPSLAEGASLDKVVDGAKGGSENFGADMLRKISAGLVDSGPDLKMGSMPQYLNTSTTPPPKPALLKGAPSSIHNWSGRPGNLRHGKHEDYRSSDRYGDSSYRYGQNEEHSRYGRSQGSSSNYGGRSDNSWRDNYGDRYYGADQRFNDEPRHDYRW